MRGPSQQSNPDQTELDDLQREYRKMELNRKSVSNDESVQNTVRMQRQQIDKLKKDNERLKEDLALETRQAKQANNMSASAQISKLQDQADMYHRKTILEAKKIEELKKKLNELQNSLLDQKKVMGGINAARDRNKHVHRQIRTLESRLDKALVKYNEANSHNGDLTKTITDLRRERTVFDNIQKKLEKELQDKKKKMAQIIEVSNAAYEARDKAQAEMVQLKAQADIEQARFEKEWSQLGQLIEKDRRMKDMMLQRDHEEHMSGKVDPVYEEEARLRQQVAKGYGNIQQNRADIHASMEKVQSYEEAFAKIQKATNITDVDKLVDAFTKAEETNFSLFNFVNDLSNDIEQHEECCASLREELKKYQVGGATGKVRAKKLVVENLSQTLTNSDEKGKSFLEQTKATEASMNALQKGIVDLYAKLKCDDPQTNEALTCTGVTENNMMQFLSVIESRTSELVQIYESEQINENSKEWEDNTVTFEEPAEAAADGEASAPAEVPAAEDASAEAPAEAAEEAAAEAAEEAAPAAAEAAGADAAEEPAAEAEPAAEEGGVAAESS